MQNISPLPFAMQGFVTIGAFRDTRYTYIHSLSLSICNIHIYTYIHM